MTTGGRQIIGNLDCEVVWAGGAALPAAVTARLAILATTLRVLDDDADLLWLPAAVPDGCIPDDGGPRPRLCWGPMPSGPFAARLAWGVDRRVSDLSAAAVARGVNDRRFAAALAAGLGIALPGARTITTVDELIEHLAAGAASASPTGAWVVKAAWTAAGRERVRRTGDRIDAATRTRVERLLAVHGALVFEPWMARTLDVGQGGHVLPGGAVAILPPHRGLVDDGGVVRGIVIDDGAALEDSEREQLAEVALAAGRALGAAGYLGPFVVDAFVHEHGGRRALHPLCELNARWTFGLVARAWADRRGAPLTLGLGGAMPPGGTALVIDENGAPAAWVVDSHGS